MTPTPEDREAAAKWMAERMALVMAGEAGSGELSLIEAFMRHRLAAEERGARMALEAAAKVLEADAQLCDCFAHSEDECGCGAWTDSKTVPVERMVELVRQIDPASLGAD